MEIKDKITRVFSTPITVALATVTEDGKPWVRYMVGVMDPNDLKIRFASYTGSRKIQNIEHDSEVHLACGMLEAEHPCPYLQIQGTAIATRDEQERKGMWNDIMAKYFKDVNDPNYTIIIVEPYRIEYYEPGKFEPEVWVK